MPRDGFQGAAKVIKGAAGLLALLPGVAMLTQAIALPPSLATTIKALALACGVLVVLLVVVSQERIYAAGRSAFMLLMISVAAIGCTMMLYHLNFASDHLLILTAGGADTMVALPTNPSPKLQAILNEFGQDYGEALMNPTAGPEVQLLIEEENGSANVVIITTLVISQLLITLAIVASAWRVAHVFDSINHR